MKNFKKALAIFFAVMFVFSAISVSAYDVSSYVKWESANGEKDVDGYYEGILDSSVKQVRCDGAAAVIYKYTASADGFIAIVVSGGTVKCSSEIRFDAPYGYKPTFHSTDDDYNDVYIFNFESGEEEYIQVNTNSDSATMIDIEIIDLGACTALADAAKYEYVINCCALEKNYSGSNKQYIGDTFSISSDSNKTGITNGKIDINGVKATFDNGEYIIDNVKSNFPAAEYKAIEIKDGKEIKVSLDEFDGVELKFTPADVPTLSILQKIGAFFVMIGGYIWIGLKAIFDFFRTIVKNYI